MAVVNSILRLILIKTDSIKLMLKNLLPEIIYIFDIFTSGFAGGFTVEFAGEFTVEFAAGFKDSFYRGFCEFTIGLSNRMYGDSKY